MLLAGLERWFSRSRGLPRAISTAGSVFELHRCLKDGASLLVTTDTVFDLLGEDVGGVPPSLVVMARPDVRREAELLRAGADGVVPLDCSREHIIESAERVWTGQTVASSDALRALAEPGTDERLTPRQLEVLTLVARDLSTGEIARELRVSPSTVKTHLSRLCERFDLSGRRALTRAAPELIARAAHGSERKRAGLRLHAPVVVGAGVSSDGRHRYGQWPIEQPSGQT